MKRKSQRLDPISFILKIQQELVDDLKVLGTQPAPYPTLKKKLNEALDDKKLKKIKQRATPQALEQLEKLLPYLVPAADVTGTKVNLLKQLTAVINSLSTNTNFKILVESLVQFETYYKNNFKKDVIEPLAWASAIGVETFYIEGNEELSSAELALNKLLLRDKTGNRIPGEQFAFGTNRWGQFQSLHIKPMSRSSELAEIRKHNVIGSWLQLFNQRHKVFSPAIRLKLSHIQTNFSVKNKHEFDRVEEMIETYGTSKKTYLSNEIKVSPFIPEGVEIAIILETMSALHNWKKAFEEKKLISLFEKLGEIDVMDNTQWPKELVEKSGCVLDERKRLPLYYLAMQKLLNNYSAKKAIDEIPNILNKISSYSFTSLLVAALACVPEDFIGTNIMLCPTDENKSEFYFKVIDSKRAHFHAITQNGDAHYVNLDLILLKFPQMSEDANDNFVNEFTSMNALEWLMLWCEFQNQQEDTGHNPYKYRPETLTDKLAVIKNAQEAILRKKGKLTNKEISQAAQPIVILFYDKTLPTLTDETNLGLSINEEFTACTRCKPSIELLFTGSLKGRKESSKAYMLVSPVNGEQTTLAKLLEPYSHAPCDHEKKSLSIQEAIVHLLSSVDYADYYTDEKKWRDAYKHCRDKFPFLAPFDQAYTLKINQALKSIMIGNMSYFKENNSNRDEVFNRIQWKKIANQQNRLSQKILDLSPKKPNFFKTKRNSAPLRTQLKKNAHDIRKSNTKAKLGTVAHDNITHYQILTIASTSKFEFKRAFKLVDCPVDISPFIEDFFSHCHDVVVLDLSNSKGVKSDVFEKMSNLGNLQSIKLNRVEVEAMVIIDGPLASNLRSITMRNCKQLNDATLNLPHLQSLDFSGTDGLSGECVNAILINSPSLNCFFFNPKNNYNLKPFLEYAFRQGKLFGGNSQSDILKSIVVNEKLHFYGIPIAPKELSSLSRALKRQKTSSRFNEVDFTGCTLASDSILEFVASQPHVKRIHCNQKISQNPTEEMELFCTSEQSIKQLLPLINGNIMTVYPSGDYDIWNVETRKKTEHGNLVNADLVHDVTQLSNGGFAIVTDQGLVVKESLTGDVSILKEFTSKLERKDSQSKSRNHYCIVEVSSTCLALLTDKLEFFAYRNKEYKQTHTFDKSSTSMITAGPSHQLAIVINEKSKNEKGKKHELKIYSIFRDTMSMKFTTSFNEKIEAAHFVDEEKLIVATKTGIFEVEQSKKGPRLLYKKQTPVNKFINIPRGQVIALLQNGSLHIIDFNDKNIANEKSLKENESKIDDLTLAQDGTLIFSSQKTLSYLSGITQTYELPFREPPPQLFTFTCTREENNHSIEIKYTGEEKNHWGLFKMFIVQFIEEAEIIIDLADSLQLKFNNLVIMNRFYEHILKLPQPTNKNHSRLVNSFSGQSELRRRSSLGNNYYEFNKKSDTGRGYY